jgi:hypothetical protein
MGISTGIEESAFAASKRGECFARMSNAGDNRVGLVRRYIVNKVWKTSNAESFRDWEGAESA